MKKILLLPLMFIIITFTFPAKALAGMSMFDRGPEKERRVSAPNMPGIEEVFVKGDYSGALNLGTAYLKKHSKNSERVECLVGRSLLKLNRLDEARGYFLKVAEKTKDRKYLSEADMGMADSYYLDGEYRQARDYYEKLVRSYPDADEISAVYYKLGECYTKLNSLGAAKEYFDKILKLYPDSLEAKLLKGEGLAQVNYSVQAGSFNRKDNAEKLRAELEKKGFDANIQVVAIDGAPFYRVRVGDYSNLKDAEDAAKNLQARGYTTKVCP